MNYWGDPFGRAEALRHQSIIATYYVSADGYSGTLQKAGGFAVGQTIGTWVSVPGVSQEMVERYQGHVVGLYDADPQSADAKHFFLRVAFPIANFGGSLTQMMTALVGNDVSTSLKSKLIDLELCCDAASAFTGPRLGMEYLRELTGIRNRPLVLNMIKPCAGFSPEEGAKLFRQVALGGVDLIKDDELLGSPIYNDVAKRTALYLKEANRAADITGHRALYLPNISGRPQQMREHIRAVLDAGAQACLINFVFGGLDTLLELSEEFGNQIFMLAHYAGFSVMDAIDSGISSNVFLGILPRLAGAHSVMTMCPRLNDPSAVHTFVQTVQMQRLPIPGIAPVVTTVGGGITPVNQRPLQQLLGQDTIIGIGGAIQGHPMGATEGARAAMCAVQATADAVALEDAAIRCEPLRVALELWPA